jgi:hypothetical protein
MENTLENKAKFFALYYGQKVLCIRKNESPVLYVGFDDLQNNKVREDDYLELAPLSQITDEDAIEVCRILKPNEDYHHDAKMGKYLIRSLDNMLHNFSRYLKLINFLRSKGYYIGDGTEVFFGWAKLKEATNEH